MQLTLVLESMILTCVEAKTDFLQGNIDQTFLRLEEIMQMIQLLKEFRNRMPENNLIMTPNPSGSRLYSSRNGIDLTGHHHDDLMMENTSYSNHLLNEDEQSAHSYKAVYFLVINTQLIHFEPDISDS